WHAGFEGHDIILPSLLSIHFVNTAPGFISSFLRALHAPLLENVDMTIPPHPTYDQYGREVFDRWGAAAWAIPSSSPHTLTATTLKLRNRDVEYGMQEIISFVAFLSVILPSTTRLEIERKSIFILDGCRVLGEKRLAGSQLHTAWTKLEQVVVCDRFYEEDKVEFDDVVKFLTKVYQSMREKGGTIAKRLELHAHPRLRPPAGKGSTGTLREQVEELRLS
ncbi:hypothetical protein FRB90_012144, partial [Tulasnella sp. 427]